MSRENSHPHDKIHELNPKPENLSMLEKIDGLDHEDARFLILLSQRIGDDKFGDALFALRFTLTITADPQKLIRDIETQKDYDRRLYREFHKRRQLLGKTGPVLEDEPSLGELGHEILNLDEAELETHLSNKYKEEEKESQPEAILKQAANDFGEAIKNLTDDERERLFKILGVRSVENDQVLFNDNFTQTPKIIKKRSKYIEKIAASLSGDYKAAISENPILDPETHKAIKESGQDKPPDFGHFSLEEMVLTFGIMSTGSLVRKLVAKNLTPEMRDAALNEFLGRCKAEMSSPEYKLFQGQVNSLRSKEDWRGIVELARNHLQSKK